MAQRLGPFGIVSALTAASPCPQLPPIDSATAPSRAPPGLAQRLRFYFTGTPWDPAE
ncbi:UNVERIFIED_CONTAM: hypothetical protein IGO34_27745 [Salmonella enterica subsp. enterica serovar Weltevreden]